MAQRVEGRRRSATSLHTLSPAPWRLPVPAGLLFCPLSQRLVGSCCAQAFTFCPFHSHIPERAQKHPRGVPFRPLQTCCHPHTCSTFPTVQTHSILDCWYLEIKLTFLSNMNLHHAHDPIIFPASQAGSL